MATYAEYHETILDENGNPISGATLTVVNSTTSVAATLYNSHTGSTQISNPVVADSYGRIQFFVAGGRYNLTYAGSGLTGFTRSNVEIESVLDHSTLATLDHPDGSVTADKLSTDIDTADLDIAIHAARTTAVHGLGSNYFAESAADGGTSPTFVDLTVTGTFDPATFAGIVMCDTGDDLQTKIDATPEDGCLIIGPGQYSLTSAVNVGGPMVILGNGAYITSTSAITLMEIETEGKVVVQGIQFAGAAGPTTLIDCVEGTYIVIENCEFNGSVNDGIKITSGDVKDVRISNCTFNDIAGAAIYETLISGKLTVESCRFEDCNSNGTWNRGTIRIEKGASWFAGGHDIKSCNFEQGSYQKCIDIANPNCLIQGNYFGSLTAANYAVIQSTATNTWMIANSITAGATLSDAGSNVVSFANSPDYTSAITTVTCSSDDEMILAATFSHNLNTKYLQCLLLCSGTFDFSGDVWQLHHHGVFNGLDDTVNIIFPDNNTCKVLLKSHARREGASISSTKTYVQQIADETNYADLYTSGLADFSGAGGHAYSTVYLRLSLWRL